jgi:hypothetical protein
MNLNTLYAGARMLVTMGLIGLFGLFILIWEFREGSLGRFSGYCISVGFLYDQVTLL